MDAAHHVSRMKLLEETVKVLVSRPTDEHATNFGRFIAFAMYIILGYRDNARSSFFLFANISLKH